MRLKRWSFLLLAAWCAVPLAASDIREPMDAPALVVAPSIVVDNFDISPAGNMTLGGNRLELHVKALAGAGYDSNVLAVPGGSPDHYGRGMAGFAGRYLPSPDATFAFDVEVERISYTRYSADDAYAGRVRLDGVWDTDTFVGRGHAAAVRSEEPLFETGQQVLHDDFSSELAIDPQHTFMPWQARLRLERREYLSDSTLFQRDAADHTAIGVSLRQGRLAADGAETYARAEIIEDVYDTERQYNDHLELLAVLGGHEPVGGRSHLDCEAGLDQRWYTGTFADDAAYDDRRMAVPYLNASATWGWEEDSSIRAALVSRLDDSYFSNAVWVYGVEGGLRWRLLKASYAYASGSALRTRNSGAAAGAERIVRDDFSGETGIVYAMRDGVALRMRVGDTLDRATGALGYHRLLASIDLAAVY